MNPSRSFRCAAVLFLASCATAGQTASAPGELTDRPGNPPIRVTVQHGSPRERQVRAELLAAVGKYDLTAYTFTRDVIIDQGVINHSFPTITLNVRFAGSEDELLSSYLHEQLHRHLRNHNAQQEQAIAELQRMYPNAPVGLPEAAESAYSTYGHLVDCYLEIQADRQLLGAERAAQVIARKPNYMWIYQTILRDETKIAVVVRRHRLEVLLQP